MSGTCRNVTVRNLDNDYYCLICGDDDERYDKLEVVQVGGGSVERTHGHCYAEIHIEFAMKSLERSMKRLHKPTFDARGAVKCLDAALDELRAAKDCLTGKALWPNLC
jgi:hypothetical protein